MTDNPHVRAGLTWAGVRWAFTSAIDPYWQPLTWLSHMLDVEMFGVTPAGPHVVNVLWHAMSTLVLFGWLTHATRSRLRSAFVAAVFAVHPLHVESVAWVAERKDVLSTCLAMLGIWAYVCYTQAPHWRRYALVLVLFAMSLAAKPMAVTLPLVLLLLDVWPLGRLRLDSRADWRSRIVEKVPLAALSVATAAATIATQVSIGALASVSTLPFDARLGNALVSYTAYLSRTLWPAHLSAFYPHEDALLGLRATLSFGALSGMSLAAWRARAAAPFVLVGWIWFLVTLLPVIGLVQSGEQASADRFMYVPLVGLAIAAAWGVPHLTAAWSARWRPVLLGAAVTSALVLMIIATRGQVLVWKDDVTLWTRAVAVTSRNYIAHNLLGLAWRDREHWESALTQYRLARSLAPAGKTDFVALVEYNMGQAKARLGQTGEAIAHYQDALRWKPDLIEAQNDLGAALTMTGRPAEALPHFYAVLDVRPDSADAQNGAGAALAMQGDHDAAIAHYRQAIRIAPNLAIARANLASAYLAEGRQREALDELLAALSLDANQPVWHFNAGALLASSGRHDEAMTHFEAALRLDPSMDAARRALGALHDRHDR